MNTFYFIIQQTMFFAMPLLVVALGALYSEKSGVNNIALEGIMVIGGFAGILTNVFLSRYISGQLLYIIIMAVGAVAGGLFSIFHAWSAIKLKADQTISGTALNLFAPAFCIFVTRAEFGVRQIDFTDTFFISKVPVLGDIPVLGPMFFRNCYISTYIAFAIFAGLYILLKKTRFGLRLSACGENPEAAASAGVPVARIRYIGVIISGALGGLGGLIFVIPTSTNFSATVAGYGFLALAVLILGQWKPGAVLLASLFFGVLKAVSSSYSGIPFLEDLDIPSEIYKIIPYVLTLVVLAVCSGRSAAPKSAGKPYDDGAGPSNGRQKAGRTVFRIFVILAFVVITIGALFNDRMAANKRAVSDGYGAEIALALKADGSVDDKSFVQQEWDGVIAFTDEHDITRKYYTAKDNSHENLYNNVKLAVKGNAEVVIASSSEMASAVYAAQDEFPNVKFVLMDEQPHPDGKPDETYIAPNTLCLYWQEQQPGFLAGYAAVMEGYRSLGYIGGMSLPPVVRYGYGFVNGAEYAAKELGLKKGEVTIRYNYAGTFNATPEVLSLASSWYQSGTEVIFACGGGLGNSVMKAAETNGKAVIGVDADQSVESPSVITSALKRMDIAMYVVLDGLNNGTIKAGDKATLTAADEVIGLPMETSKFKNFTQEQYDEIYDKMAQGKIKLFSDTDAETADGLPLEYVNIRVIK